jgi:hypothetical protein
MPPPGMASAAFSTAKTFPCVGFSLAVSGMYNGPRMDSASSSRWVSTRLPSGWILTVGSALAAIHSDASPSGQTW